VVRESVRRSGLDPAQIETLVMGNVIQAGAKMNPARQAAIGGGLPVQVPARARPSADAEIPAWCHRRPMTEQTAESYAATFDTNVLGTLLSMKHERPEEIADAIVYLGSDKASYLTGQIIRVNGGKTAL